MPANLVRIFRPLLALFLGGLLFLSPAGCRTKPTHADNFLLITLDTTRADFVGAYRPGNALTPALDALAAEGTLFEDANGLIPITLPAHASMFFSDSPHAVRSYNNGQSIRPSRARASLADLFRREGFTTAAFVSLGVLMSEYGLDEGFETYSASFRPDRWYLSADEVNAKVFPWLEAHRTQKFFLWVHYSDPHDPYAPPDTPDDTKIFLNGKLAGETSLAKGLLTSVRLDLEEGPNKLRIEIAGPGAGGAGPYSARLDELSFDPPADPGIVVKYPNDSYFRRDDGIRFLKSRCAIEIECRERPRSVTLAFRGRRIETVHEARDGYRKEVEFMDGEIGRLFAELRRLGLYDRTAILAVGDHGEGLGEYRTSVGDPYVGHIHYLNPVYMNVPFIFRLPGDRSKGVRRAETVTLLDVAPTVTGIMGLAAPASFQGRDLRKLAPGSKTVVFQETYKPEAVRDRFGILDEPHHLVFCPETDRYEYFDHRTDPDEHSAITLEDGLPVEAMALKTRLDAFVRDILKNKEDIRIEGKTEEMLKSLGYLGNKE